MLLDYLLAPLIIISLMALWIVIQFAWKRFFPEQLTDEDVLAMRPKCGACHLGEDCLENGAKCEKEALNLY
jgi:hypothetical protein